MNNLDFALYNAATLAASLATLLDDYPEGSRDGEHGLVGDCIVRLTTISNALRHIKGLAAPAPTPGARLLDQAMRGAPDYDALLAGRDGR